MNTAELEQNSSSAHTPWHVGQFLSQAPKTGSPYTPWSTCGCSSGIAPDCSVQYIDPLGLPQNDSRYQSLFIHWPYYSMPCIKKAFPALCEPLSSNCGRLGSTPDHQWPQINYFTTADYCLFNDCIFRSLQGRDGSSGSSPPAHKLHSVRIRMVVLPLIDPFLTKLIQ
jgi:hypothetical protein